MIADCFLQLAEIEQRVCDVASKELGIGRPKLSPSSRLIEDLGCDSLDAVDLLIAIEDAFCVTLPDTTPNPVYKAVFTRQPFRLSDLAELVYLQQGTGAPERGRWRRWQAPPAPSSLPFTQLTGRWQARSTQRLLEPLKSKGPIAQYRRRSDGMRCVLIPSASVEIGCPSSDSLPDERPRHVVEMDAFLIDAEPVSTTAYCRFLNSIGDVDPEIHADWFTLDREDDRNAHMLLERAASEWRPLPGTERWPMILVSWHGANAYALWANGCDWKNYRAQRDSQAPNFLPTEAQWEYAARGHRFQTFPWGDGEPSQDLMRFGQHQRFTRYRADTLPMAPVNAQLGMSPFGLHHMAGNIWQWCRDWYDEAFYQRSEATTRNAWNRVPTKVRSERGGSWIGPADLCRSSFRRGRPPTARGRCLGFRCVSTP